MITFWTERTRRMQAALEHHASLRVAFTVYSFITLFLFTPAPALGSSTHAEISPESGAARRMESYNPGSGEVREPMSVQPCCSRAVTRPPGRTGIGYP